MPEDNARSFFLKVEQVHFASDFAMVALFGLFEHMEIGIKFFLRMPSRCVDARSASDCCYRRANRLQQLSSI